MSRVGRLAGGILAETEGIWFLVGDLKEPCDWGGAGFADPGEIRHLERPYLKLESVGEPDLAPPILGMGLEGEDLPRMLADRLLIRRNGSVSERLWNVILDGRDDPAIDAAWLAGIPRNAWEALRDAVLRCV